MKIDQALSHPIGKTAMVPQVYLEIAVETAAKCENQQDSASSVGDGTTMNLPNTENTDT